MANRGLAGHLALMLLKTLNALGPQHGYGIARASSRPAPTCCRSTGTLYPVLLKLEQEGAIASEWGLSNNRRAKFYPHHQPAKAAGRK